MLHISRRKFGPQHALNSREADLVISAILTERQEILGPDHQVSAKQSAPDSQHSFASAFGDVKVEQEALAAMPIDSPLTGTPKDIKPLTRKGCNFPSSVGVKLHAVADLSNKPLVSHGSMQGDDRCPVDRIAAQEGCSKNSDASNLDVPKAGSQDNSFEYAGRAASVSDALLNPKTVFISSPEANRTIPLKSLPAKTTSPSIPRPHTSTAKSEDNEHCIDADRKSGGLELPGHAEFKVAAVAAPLKDTTIVPSPPNILMVTAKSTEDYPKINGSIGEKKAVQFCINAAPAQPDKVDSGTPLFLQVQGTSGVDSHGHSAIAPPPVAGMGADRANQLQTHLLGGATISASNMGLKKLSTEPGAVAFTPVAPDIAHLTDVSPKMLEVGIKDSTAGWIRIRAELEPGGGVKASLAPQTELGNDALQKSLPGLHTFLSSEKVLVQSVVLERHAPFDWSQGRHQGSSTRQEQGEDRGQRDNDYQQDSHEWPFGSSRDAHSNLTISPIAILSQARGPWLSVRV